MNITCELIAVVAICKHFFETPLVYPPMKCYIPTFEASREGQQYVRVISVRVRADLSLNLANFNINGFFSTDAHRNDQSALLFVLKRPIFGYITLHWLIYQERLKKN